MFGEKYKDSKVNILRELREIVVFFENERINVYDKLHDDNDTTVYGIDVGLEKKKEILRRYSKMCERVLSVGNGYNRRMYKDKEDFNGISI